MTARLLSLFLIYLLVLGTGIPCGADDNPDRVRVITYNVQFLPGPASVKNERPQPLYRARRIAEELQSYDIVALQEVFDDEVRQQLIEHFRKAWDGKLNKVFSPHPEGFFTNGGCLILTPHPIVAAHTVVFENFSKYEDFGLRADGLAAKGVVHARVQFPGDKETRLLDVFATHLEARDDSLRPLQYKELADFIKLNHDLASPCIALGDFNTQGAIKLRNDESSQYAELIRQLNRVRRFPFVDVWPLLHDDLLGGTTKQESAEIGKRIDYIFLSNPTNKGPRLKPVTAIVELFRDPRVFALSDHNAVAAEFIWESP